MVNIFIVHSGLDYTYITETLEPYLRGETDENGNHIKSECFANILTLQSAKGNANQKNGAAKKAYVSGNNWKTEARKLIKMSQVVIVVVGNDSSKPEKSKTMGFETKVALKYNKQIMIIDLAGKELPEYLKQPDRFTKLDQPVASTMTMSEIKDRIYNFSNGYYDIFSQNFKSMDQEERSKHKNELLDQYKMFQKSSEDLVSRRQSVNSFYISVNSALVALMGIIMGIVESPSKCCIILFMSIVGIILDFSWINILDAYGTLNGAKMKVIGMMERQLPIALYDTEWRVMSDKLNNKKYVSFTDSEKRIPKIFAFVYCFLIVIMLIYILFQLLGA